MHILQVSTILSSGGGIQTHILEMSAWLRARGHQVSLSGGGIPDPAVCEDPDFHPISLEHVSDKGGGTGLIRSWHALSCALSLRSFIKTRKIQLIHAHESAPALVSWLAAFGLKIPIVVTYHGSAQERVKSFARIAQFTADLVITPSHQSASDLQRLGGLDLAKTRVIGLGINPAPDVNSEIVADLRHQLLGCDGQFLVVVIARLAYQKGIDCLIEVVKRVSAVQGDIRFVVVGGGPLSNSVEQWAADADVKNYVKFAGRSENPYHYLMAGDLFLLSSRWEALPISIVEAFRSGLPVVSTDAGGVRELVDSSVGEVVPIGDSAALAANVLRLREDPVLRKKMSDAALARSREDRFSPDHIYQIFEKTYLDSLR